jgi:hypothetical protein
MREDFVIVKANDILIPVDRILRDYWHLEPYLLEHQVSLKGLTELSFSISDLHLSFDRSPPHGWSVLSILEDHFLNNVKGHGSSSELTDDEAIALHNLTCLAHEIHMQVTDMVRQYTPVPNYGYHSIRKWIGNNILIESYR